MVPLVARRFVEQLRHGAADVLFPPACCGCGAALASEPRREFCPGCLAELTLIDGPGCGRCGAPVAEVGRRDDCPHCAGRAMRFDRAVALGVYDGLLRRVVLAAKEQSGEAASAALGRMIAGRALACGVQPPDVVTCVPMHWRRRATRRHNSPEVMAEAISRRLGVRFQPRLLGWRQAARKQAELSMTDRRRNVRGKLCVRRPARVRGAAVLLVDDILTTGATCSEAARVLREGGAARVEAVVAARSL